MSPSGQITIRLADLESFQRLCMKLLDLAEEARSSYPSDDLGERIASTVTDFIGGES